MTQQPTNPEHFWRYHSSLETQPAAHNISALGDYHQWTNPTLIIPSEREELIRREAEQYGDGANGDSITDLQLSWGRSFIPDNYSSGSDQFLSSSGSFNLMRGLDPDMSSGGDQQWRLSATSSLACNHMLLHHPLSTQTYSSTNSHKMGGLLGSHGISQAVVTTKRPAATASFYESKESQTDAKKSRCSSTSRSSSSSPILKVRKEKLGGRIAALQKLVAPFGKTDTASVLTEAIGYIQFLHNQVQRLSVPYMKSTGRAVQVSSRQEEGKEEQKAELQSRGLCLVPHSWASFLDSSSFGL